MLPYGVDLRGRKDRIEDQEPHFGCIWQTGVEEEVFEETKEETSAKKLAKGGGKKK